MKLLPKSKINEQFNEEKRQNIIAGVFLAKKIDALREEVLTLQKTRDEFIAGSQQVINDSLSSLQQKQDSLSKEIKELEVKRLELLMPVEEERIKYLNLQKEQKELQEKLEKWDYEILLKQIEIDNEKKEISKIAEQTKFEASEAEKAKNSALSFKAVAQQEYKTAKDSRESFEKESKQKLSELQQKIATYENGISVNELKEKDLETREVALLSEQKHLESQQRQLRIAYEIIKKNGTSNN